MIERQIPFKGPMVQAILDGRKTQTRRTNGLERFNEQPGRWRLEGDTFAFDGGFEYAPVPKCPYGVVGDRLWVRETWAIGVSTGNSWSSEDGSIKAIAEPQRYQRRYAADGIQGFFGKWRPSIYMPRWASRITLEITEIRVQRLQDIKEEDAKAEGSFLGRCQCLPMSAEKTPLGACFSQTWCHIHGQEFKDLWQSINGPDSWAANPWVWCVSFRKVPV